MSSESTDEELAGLMARIEHADCPPAYGDCSCSCHFMPGTMHIMACCHPDDEPTEKFLVPFLTLRRGK